MASKKPKSRAMTKTSRSQASHVGAGRTAIHGNRFSLPTVTPRCSTQVEQPKIVVTQQQSTEQMKIVSLAVISRIAFNRDLFPKLREHYEARTYDPNNPKTTYKEFLEASNDIVQDFQRTSNLTNWKILPRGRDKGADKILEYLEEGISHAIEQQRLSSFKLTIHKCDGQMPCVENMIEFYTISFTYGPQSTIDVRSGPGNSTESDLLIEAKSKLYNLVQSVGDRFRDQKRLLAQLPGSIRLNVLLQFSQECPGDYQPPNFRQATNETRRIASASTSILDLGVDLQFHSIKVGWSLPAQLEPPVIDIRNAVTTGYDDHEVNCAVPYIVETDEGTQLSVLNKLKKMGVSRQTVNSTQDTQALSSSPENFMDPESQEMVAGLRFTQEIQIRVQRAKEMKAIAVRENHEKPQDYVRCKCNSVSTESLVKCDICNYQQHLPCHGYLKAQPPIHVCYDCLFEGLHESNPQVQELREICVFRRALFYLYKNGPEILLRDLSAFLGDDEYIVGDILRQLSSTHGLKVRYNRDERNKHDTMTIALDNVDMASIFDPAHKIHHLIHLDTDTNIHSGLTETKVQSSFHNALTPLRRSRRILSSGSTTAAEDVDSPSSRISWSRNSRSSKRRFETPNKDTNKKHKVVHYGERTPIEVTR